jgi:hypothetical protein
MEAGRREAGYAKACELVANMVARLEAFGRLS